MRIGVLGIQGSVEEHLKVLKSINAEPVLVKKTEDLDNISGLIIPGGESTAIDKNLQKHGLKKKIIQKGLKGLPIWGTCAGTILLAKYKLMNIAVKRNAYGRQLDSFETDIKFDFGRMEPFPAIFIRAPRIPEVGEKVRVLAEYKGETVAAVENNFFATTFHPELTDNPKVHRWFLNMCSVV